jgi:hypothetical protein
LRYRGVHGRLLIAMEDIKTRRRWLSAYRLKAADLAAVADVSERNLRASMERGVLNIGRKAAGGWFLRFSIADAITTRTAILLGPRCSLEKAAEVGREVALMAEEIPVPRNGARSQTVERSLIVGFPKHGPPEVFHATHDNWVEYGVLLRRPYVVVPADAIIADTLKRVAQVLSGESPSTDDGQHDTNAEIASEPMTEPVSPPTAEMAADPNEGVMHEPARD